MYFDWPVIQIVRRVRVCLDRPLDPSEAVQRFVSNSRMQVRVLGQALIEAPCPTSALTIPSAAMFSNLHTSRKRVN